MSQVRRRVLRPVPELLVADRVALRRWMTSLKRAFNTVDRLSARIARLERHLAR